MATLNTKIVFAARPRSQLDSKQSCVACWRNGRRNRYLAYKGWSRMDFDFVKFVFDV